ncbi:MAG TPA: hypothetical protein VMA83_05715 [Solirubrobacteraceae bacterium]|nr:hypothetical protein [Solirubrobacteraceae bacterium]
MARTIAREGRGLARLYARGGLVVCACVALLASVAPAANAAGSKPKITDLAASPATVPSGGATTITATVTNATSCTLSSTASRPVSGLPVTFPCESGSIDRELTMPANTGKKAVAYKLKLVATGGDGSTSSKLTVKVSAQETGLGGVAQVVAGGGSTCALLSSGRVDCWGDNNDGQLGTGNTKNAELPAEVRDLTDATQIAPGGTHSCAVRSTGHVACWGDNEYGDLGDGSTVNSSTPVEVDGISDASAVTVGVEFSCALLTTSHVRCWGYNDHGELGDGNTKSSDTPTEVSSLADATSVSAGQVHVCALLSTMAVDCWGADETGQLGDGVEEVEALTPVEVDGHLAASEVSAGGYGTCGRLTTGTVDCWGFNEYGQLGDGSEVGSDVPVETLESSGASAVASGWMHACALMPAGRIECWGENEAGELGNGTMTTSPNPVPVEVHGIEGATSVTAAVQFSCALIPAGHVVCWGQNSYGQLGDGSTKSSATPVEVHA